MRNYIKSIGFIYLFYLATSCFAQKGKTVISGYIKTSIRPDTMVLDILSEFGTGNFGYPTDTTLISIARKGHFSFSLPRYGHPVYVNLHTSKSSGFEVMDWNRHELYQYLVMPGDSIFITFNETNRTANFTGNGAIKFRWMYDTDLALNGARKSKGRILKMDAKEYFPFQDSLLFIKLSKLKAIKFQLTNKEYDLLYADAYGRQVGGIFSTLADLNFMYSYGDKQFGDSYFQAFNEWYKANNSINKSDWLAYSLHYVNFLMQRSRVLLAAKASTNNREKHEGLLDLKNLLMPGLLKDKLLTNYLFALNSNYGFKADAFKEGLNEIKSPTYRKILMDIVEANGTGNFVDSLFRFTDVNGKYVKLGDFRNKVVLIDFWFTGCTGCIEVAKGLKKIEPEFANKDDVVFLSLSIDKDKETWKRSIKDPNLIGNKLAYTHFTSSRATYVYTSGTGANNAFIKRYNPGNSYPQIMLLDRAGRIFKSDPPKPFDLKGQQQLIAEINAALAAK